MSVQLILLSIVLALGISSAGAAFVPFSTTIQWYTCPLFTFPQPTSQSPFLGVDENGAALSAAAIAERHITITESNELLKRVRKAASGDSGASFPHGPLGLPRTALLRSAYAAGSSVRDPLPIINAECADVSVPLYYPESDPNTPSGSWSANETITVFVKRYRGTPDTPNVFAPQSIWFLQGGPGDSSEAMEQLLLEFHNLMGSAIDVYTMDHRGVGRSQRMGCERPQAETPGSYGGVNIAGPDENTACNNEIRHSFGTALYSYAFSADNAARDLARAITLIKAEAPPAMQMFVYGVSYGTMWTQRYAALYPTQSTAVVLDGVVTLSGGSGRRLTFDNWEPNMNGVVERYLSQYCAASTFCTSKLGPKPLDYAREVFGMLYGDNGGSGDWCTGVTDPVLGLGVTRDVLRLVFGIVSTSMYLRQLIPATLYRLRRCNANDVWYMQVLLSDLSSNPDPGCLVGLDSQLLQNNIGSSELWDNTRSLDSLEAQVDQAMFASDLSVGFWLNIHNYSFPQYPVDPRTFNKTLLAPNLPVLLLNGDLDPQTPIQFATATAADLQGRTKSAQFITFPGSAHGTILRSPTTNSSAPPCAVTIIKNYLQSFTNGDYNAGVPLDTGCLQHLRHVGFSGDGSINVQIIGTPDLYDGTVPIPQPLVLQCGDNVSRSIFNAVVGTLCAMIGIFIIAACYFLQQQKNTINELSMQLASVDPTGTPGGSSYAPVSVVTTTTTAGPSAELLARGADSADGKL